MDVVRACRKALGLAALVAAATLSSAAAAQDVRHRAQGETTVAGRTIAYTAEVGEIAVSSPDRPQDASVGYMAYVAQGAADRPVLFAFNGGPGASASFLHMGALGPVRARVPQDPAAPLPAEAEVGANPDTLLDTADLVMLDPPGTGFSAFDAGADMDWYRSVDGDADAVAQAVLAWLRANGRLDAPIYVLGESYGTIRATAMIEALHKRAPEVRLAGVLLIGQALNMIETSQRPDNVVTYPVALPTLAAIACYHGRIGTCDPVVSADAASAFGPEYLAALYRGRALDGETRTAIAGRLAELTGIAEDRWLEWDLKLSKERFRVELLRGEGVVLGRYDARYTAPRAPDAGLTVGPDAFSPVSALYGAAMIAELTSRGVPDAENYRVIARTEGEWAYGSGDSPFNDWPFMTIAEQAMERDPHFRLFIGTGLYDLTTTVGAADYLIAQSDADRERIVDRVYRAGHVAYSDDESWQRMIGDIRAFIEGDTAQ
ncbi:S10 family serine carboxypeptidase-like protein [Pelagerythrobacter rhizovicinus]|uniref:Septum formation initiator n=1 Tax=Pelagerythrobacter rhizovicinus TaxID=2268576 RepID=A0A4Q2KK24_9SPHN|nr:septum formation initiator [Pelagerythrobacter rhizovicinus]RXZ65578.1 septum formation initiator [Pelagerythrobacter rhizovicinus]